MDNKSFGFEVTAKELRPDFQRFDIHLAVLTIFLTLCALLFNILIFYVFWSMRKSASALIFLNLAAVDVIMACLVMPYSVAILLTRAAIRDRPPPHHIFCALSGSVFETSVLCTVGFILLASADRFLGVYYHVYHRKYFSRDNLIKMIVGVWVISPLLILIFVSSWIISTSHGHHNTFTNLSILTVCMGQYWLRNANHALGNVPSYLTVAVLMLFMVIIVIGNLAVLKQLFRKRNKPLASLTTTGAPTRQRRNNTSSVMAPPILIHSDASQGTIEVAKEQLKRISLAEQDVRKSERIFQTDSHGDVTGININAIIKLYVRATRGGSKVSKTHNRKRSSCARGSPGLQISDECLASDCKSVEPTFDRLTPNTSTVCESVMEEDEEDGEEEEEDGEEEDEEEEDEEEFEFSEEEIDEELAELAGESSVSLDDEELIRSVSVSPADDADELDPADPDSDYDTVWKVIKFVAALKRNSKKRQTWDLMRSSSDSDLSMLQENSDTDYRVVTPAKDRKAQRKFSEMTNHHMQSFHCRTAPFPYQPLSFDTQVRSPTLEEIDELVNGGELSPLVKRNKQSDLASLITMVTALKRKSKEAKDKCNGQIRRSSTAVDRQVTKNLSIEEDSGCIEDYRAKAESPPRFKTSWGTLAVIAKMRHKLLSARNRATPSCEPPETSESEFQSESESGGGSELAEELRSHHRRAKSPQEQLGERGRGVNILLNTITEEEDHSPDRAETVVPARHSNLLAIPPTFSPGTSISPSDQSGSDEGDITFNTITPSRTLSMDSTDITHMQAQHPKRRRGGFLINQDDMNFTPSPSNDMFGGPSRGVRESYTSAASAFKHRMRQSTVYRMSVRNSMNITSVTQMVYNFNKHARKKKKEIRAAKTILILVAYYIVTLLFFVVSFYHVAMLQEAEKASLPYWLTFYSYIIYLNAVFNPVIHFWRNARVRHTVLKILCPKTVNERIRRWKLRGGFG